MRRLILAFAALPLIATPAFAEMATVAPEKFGEIFCIARIGNDDGILRGVLSDELRTLIDYSEARNDSIAQANPEEKPPLGDGIPWSSFPDYAAECSIGSVAVERQSARVVVDYGFPAEPGANYSDTLHLRLVAHPYDPDTGIWRLDDVAYTTSGSLRQALTSVFDNQ